MLLWWKRTVLPVSEAAGSQVRELTVLQSTFNQLIQSVVEERLVLSVHVLHTLNTNSTYDPTLHPAGMCVCVCARARVCVLTERPLKNCLVMATASVGVMRSLPLTLFPPYSTTDFTI